MRELLGLLLDCTEYVSENVTSDLAAITESWYRESQVYACLVEKIDVAWRVPLDTDLLEEFPDVKVKVAKKLEWLANEQLSTLRKLIGRVFYIGQVLKLKLDKFNARFKLISFEEHKELMHSIRENVMWIEDCWTCLHCLFMQVEFAMASLEAFDEESGTNLISAIKQDEEEKSIIGKSQTYVQSCSNLLKFLENKSKITIAR